MVPKVFKLLAVALLLSTVQAGYKRTRKKIIIYVPEVTKVIHYKHVAKVVVPQIIYKDFKPSKDYGVGLHGDYAPYAFEHVGKGYGGYHHDGAGFSAIDYGGKGYAGFSHEKGDFYGSAAGHSDGHGGSYGAGPHGSDWKGDVGASAYSAHHPQYTRAPAAQQARHREVVVRYGQAPKQTPTHNGWSSAASATGGVAVRQHVPRTAASAASGVGGAGGGWVSVGDLEVARGRDVLLGA
ncbi:heterogeneous nuclear ribonucleoprotein A3 homolog 2-like [Schistocerca gregaria]|uniref:heterogeneous nuclear ribonucleoprotein A3 homolog 2-like n=1 Tax=Schistocerca gregaria TaxID=7010 RepID=UPI00211DADCC|nr:heterogeneous nuclear ribonucleoprotein A3 homolog 2-like [Schistocerca gregaria]